MKGKVRFIEELVGRGYRDCGVFSSRNGARLFQKRLAEDPLVTVDVWVRIEDVWEYLAAQFIGAGVEVEVYWEEFDGLGAVVIRFRDVKSVAGVAKVERWARRMMKERSGGGGGR